MKKKIILLVPLFLIAGCSLKSKSVATVKLTGNPTTGYDWTCLVSDNSIANVNDGKYVALSNAEGSGGTYTFKVNGVKEGKTTMTCTYKRSWETTDSDKTENYTITIDAKLNATIKEKK